MSNNSVKIVAIVCASNQKEITKKGKEYFQMTYGILFWFIILGMCLIYMDYGMKKEFRKINKKLDDLANK